MANVRAFRSGLWSDVSTVNSPWWDGTNWYVPDASDDVFANSYEIHVDKDINPKSLSVNSSGSILWKDGQVDLVVGGGVFNLFDGVVVSTIVPPSNKSGTTCILLSGTNSATFVGTLNGAGVSGITNVNSTTISNQGTGTLSIVGDIIGSETTNTSNPSVVLNTSSGMIIHTGTIIGGSSNNRGILNTFGGTVIVVGDIYSGSGSNSIGLFNSSTGAVRVIGNLIANGTCALESSVSDSDVQISGSLLDTVEGVAAIYCNKYTINPIPQYSLLRYSSIERIASNSLPIFSTLPPTSSVRDGVSFANDTLVGTCAIPTINSVISGIPVDHTTGTAILNITQLDQSKLFETLIDNINIPDSIGLRLKTKVTPENVGRIITSFSR